MLTRRTFVQKTSLAAGIAAVSGVVGCFDEKNHNDEKNHKEETMEMKFSELIEARRSVRKYAKAKIWSDTAKIKSILGIPEKEILMSVIAVGKSAQPYFKNPRKPVAEVLKTM